MIKIKSEFIRPGRTGWSDPCGACAACHGGHHCEDIGGIAVIEEAALKAALEGSGWSVRPHAFSRDHAMLLIADLVREGQVVRLHGDQLDEAAPIELMELLVEPDPCPNRGTGCEGVIYRWNAQCGWCGGWRE